MSVDLTTITVSQFKSQFFRDFPYLPSCADTNLPADKLQDYVLDQDITNAFAEAQVVFNPALFGTDAQVTLGYLYLTAHFLCNDLRAAQSGISATGAFPVTARSVGSVSESYAIPDVYLKNPIFSQYTSTAYGMKFLAMAMPQMVGNMAAVYGGTNP